MFVSSCLGSQVFSLTLGRCSENPLKEVIALEQFSEVKLVAAGSATRWWEGVFFGRISMIPKLKLFDRCRRCLSILWKKTLYKQMERDLPQSFFSNSQVPPEELCDKLRGQRRGTWSHS